jgi:hypothetical protein
MKRLNLLSPAEPGCWTRVLLRARRIKSVPWRRLTSREKALRRAVEAMRDEAVREAVTAGELEGESAFGAQAYVILRRDGVQTTLDQLARAC